MTTTPRTDDPMVWDDEVQQWVPSRADDIERRMRWLASRCGCNYGAAFLALTLRQVEQMGRKR